MVPKLLQHPLYVSLIVFLPSVKQGYLYLDPIFSPLAKGRTLWDADFQNVKYRTSKFMKMKIKVDSKVENMRKFFCPRYLALRTFD